MTAVDAKFAEPLQCLFEPKRFKVLWGGRNAGRSWGCARALLLLGTERPIRVLCARELQKSIEESVHKVLSDQISLLGLDNFYTIFKKNIIGVNGTSFAFEGIKNNIKKIKSYEGINYCWVEEAVNVSKTSWGILIPTIIRQPSAEIWLTFNPELETDYTYKRFVKDPMLKPCSNVMYNRQESNSSIVVKMTYEDNPWFDEGAREEMEKDKAVDYDHYLNVWLGHCIQNLEGAIYAKELRKAQEEERICDVPYDREWPVDVFFDLGRADNTACWFTQRVAMQWRLLAYYEESGKDWTHFLKELQNREYIYGTIHLPHDGAAKFLGSKRTIEELTRQAGFHVNIVPKLSVVDGINAARTIFSNCYFDEEKCEDGINALRHYRYEVKNGQLSNEPKHDWASDGADAFRYFAVGAKGLRPKNNVIDALRAAATAFKAEREKANFPSDLGWMA